MLVIALAMTHEDGIYNSVGSKHASISAGEMCSADSPGGMTHGSIPEAALPK